MSFQAVAVYIFFNFILLTISDNIIVISTLNIRTTLHEKNSQIFQ